MWPDKRSASGIFASVIGFRLKNLPFSEIINTVFSRSPASRLERTLHVFDSVDDVVVNQLFVWIPTQRPP